MQKIMRRVMAVVLLAAMVVTTIGIVPEEAKAASSYPYKANMRNLLSDYQYVVKENLQVKTHTMGGVAVGGDCELADFADAMVSPSYAKHLVKVGNVKDEPVSGVPSGYHTKKFYYSSKEEKAFENYQASKFEQNTYMDMTAAFSEIQKDSEALVTGAKKAVKTGDKIVIDFSKSKKYEVPADLIASDRSVTLNIVGLASPNDLRDEEYSISVTGLNNTVLFVDFGVTSKPAGADKVLPVTWNGKPMNNLLKKISTDNYAGAQFVNSGMKLIWNFPDAVKMITEYISGHFTAPQADLTINGGNFEGGVIAKSVKTSAEGHFYPYFKVGTSRETVSGETTARKIVETALVKTLVEVGDDEEIKFIKDKDGNDVVINSDNADYQWQVFDKETDRWEDIAGANGTVLNPDKELEGKKIQCTVTGKNDYTGQAVAEGVVRALPPVEKQTNETSITIEAEDGFEYELRDKKGNIVTPWTTDGDTVRDGDDVKGTITFKGLKEDTSYDVVKRTIGESITESRSTEMSTKSGLPSASATPIVGASATPSTTPAAPGTTPIVGASATPSVTPSATPSAPGTTPIVGASATPSATPAAPSTTPIVGASAAPSVTPSAAPSVTPSATPSAPSTTPIVGASATPSATPSAPGTTPIVGASATPSVTPSATPSAPSTTPIVGASATPSTTPAAPGTTPIVGASATPTTTPVTSKKMVPPEDQTVRKGSVELKIPTIVMKKIMAPKMKFRIKLLNQKGAKIRCSSSNKKIATIDKSGLVKTKKKLGKAKLVINVTKGKKKIQYIVKLVVRTTIKKNYSLYKYKTGYKYPSVSLYKLLPKGKTYKIQLLHLNKKAKVTYKSSKPSIAKVDKKGKVTPVKNGRADITVTIVQNGITYKYFVVVRSTEKGVESNTSYLKVIR